MRDALKLPPGGSSFRFPWRLLPRWGSASRAGAGLLAVAVAASALAVGSVHTATLCAVTVILAVATPLVWWDAEPTNARRAATALLCAGVALTAYTALQCIPLPMGLLALIAPRNADIWARALAPLKEAAPGWAPLTLDPSATRVEVLKGVAYLLAFVTALRVARRRGGISFLSGALVVTGVALALAALLHPAFGVHKLYGVLQPSTSNERHVAPLLNPNNLASYLNVAFCLALASAVSHQPRVPRPIAASFALLLLGTQVWVASRGGVGAMILGAVLVVALARVVVTSRQVRMAGTSLVLCIALAAGMFMLALGGADQSSSELFDTHVEFKVELFREALRMIPAYPIFGVGRGAFESAFPAFRGSIWYVTYTHPENVILQWIIEWGVPFGLGGIAVVVFALRPRAVLARSSSAAGAWAAIVVVALQNLVDLGTEVPGVMLAVVVCAAIVVGGTAGREPRWSIERWGRAPRQIAIAAVVSAVIAVALAATTIGHDLGADRSAMYDAASNKDISAAEVHDQVREAMLRHPAEPYLPYILAWRAVHAHDDDPMPWIGATLERAKVYGPAHLVLAHFIARRSPSQARLEYRLTAEETPELKFLAMGEAPSVVGGYDDAMEVVPSGDTVSMEELARGIEARLPATRARLDGKIATWAPDAAGPALRAATAAVDDLESRELAPWCLGALRLACAARATVLTSRAESLAPRQCEAFALHARAAIATGDPGPALDELTAAAALVEDRTACLQIVATLAESVHDDRRAGDALASIAAAGCSDDAECATNLAWIATNEEARGNGLHALALFKRAYQRSPTNDALLESIARLASSSGLHSDAEDAYARLARKHPTDATWKARAEAEHDSAFRRQLVP